MNCSKCGAEMVLDALVNPVCVFCGCTKEFDEEEEEEITEMRISTLSDRSIRLKNLGN